MKKASVVRWGAAFFGASLMGLGLLASGMAYTAGAAEGTAEAAGFVQLDAATEQVLNEVTALGAQMAALKEAQALSPENQLLVLVTVDPGSFSRLSAIQLQIDKRMIAFHQYTKTELAALRQGGSHRLFWGNVPGGQHQLTFSMMGHESKDSDIQRASVLVTVSGENRSVVELRITPNKDQPLPEVSLKEWK
ncbi:MAG TPA: hypothetical protein ENK04_15425 [Gammaproteobacteria bacterium]|nr:hypothetical protein [Gammaproteobacteria bacterium]